MLHQRTADELREIASLWADEGKRKLAGFGRSKFLSQIPAPDRPPLTRLYDNNSDLHYSYFEGLEILPPSLIDKERERVIVFVGPAYPAVRRQLEAGGLKEYEDFISGLEYVLLHNWFEHRRLVLQTLIITPTLKCTLRCAACSMHIPAVRRAGRDRIRPFPEMKAEIDLLMKFVALLPNLSLVGGEALLNNDLPRLIDYIRDCYRDRIISLYLGSNGTVMPKPEILEALKRGGIVVYISDYSESLGQDYQSRMAAFIAALENYGVPYELVQSKAWIRFYDEGLARMIETDDEAENHYRRCLSLRRCTGFSDGKLYICNHVWAAEMSGRAPSGSLGGLDFSRLNPDSDDDLFMILRSYLGYIDAKPAAPWLCARCTGGVIQDEANRIAVARQLAASL